MRIKLKDWFDTQVAASQSHIFLLVHDRQETMKELDMAGIDSSTWINGLGTLFSPRNSNSQQNQATNNRESSEIKHQRLYNRSRSRSPRRGNDGAGGSRIRRRSPSPKPDHDVYNSPGQASSASEKSRKGRDECSNVFVIDVHDLYKTLRNLSDKPNLTVMLRYLDVPTHTDTPSADATAR